MNCPHALATSHLAPPSASTKVYKEECTLCFDNYDAPYGIDVCLTCFNGGCPPEALGRAHSVAHYLKSGHPLAMNIKRKTVEKRTRGDDMTPPPSKITRVAIVPEEQEDRHEYKTSVKCFECGGTEVDRTAGKVPDVVAGVLSALSAQQQSDVKAWEEEIVKCDHAEHLVQETKGKLDAQGLAHCRLCDLKENLWLCLVCGSLGCGREQYGTNLGGKGHALQHYHETRHVMSCKLGTITPEGTADVYCYECNDSRLNPKLGEHLSTFGINLAGQSKTEKSIAELQLEHNLKFDFSMTTDDGKQLEPLFGSGYTGLKNLGNSCYMASIVQCLFSIDKFRSRYLDLLTSNHHETCTKAPASCFFCQMCKLADGLYSGRYSTKEGPSETRLEGEKKTQQTGIRPAMLKSLIGQSHPEFSTMRQQDAHEFFQHVVKIVEQCEHGVSGGAQDPTSLFKFELEQRIQCTECRKVRYSHVSTTDLSIPVPVRRRRNELDASDAAMDLDGVEKKNQKQEFEEVMLEECFNLFTAEEMIPDWRCPSCQKKTVAVKTQNFATFPEVLVVHIRRFELENWVPKKLDIRIAVPQGMLDLEKYRSAGKQNSEELLPEDDAGAAAGTAVDEAVVEQLMAMGFPRVRCERALLKTGNNGAEVAMNWLFEHMEDPDIDDPIDTTTAGGSAGVHVPETEISMLADMGFSPAQAKKALKETNNDMERAVEWLFSHPEETGEETAATRVAYSAADASKKGRFFLKAFVSHKGTSVHCGHYVAHVRNVHGATGDREWTLFNDERVVAAANPPVDQAYMYIFARTQ